MRTDDLFNELALGIFCGILRAQRLLSGWFDRTFPSPDYRVDGDTCFEAEFLTPFLYRGAMVMDVGGGKHPSLHARQKTALGLRVLGFDIGREELDQAPPGSYDGTICADITEFVGDDTANLAICSSLLEHVRDVDKALRGIGSMLNPGGLALIFVPCRSALFARLNLLLPHTFKRKLLELVFPGDLSKLGFPVYYDRCTPREITDLAQKMVWFPRKCACIFIPAILRSSHRYIFCGDCGK